MDLKLPPNVEAELQAKARTNLALYIWSDGSVLTAQDLLDLLKAATQVEPLEQDLDDARMQRDAVVTAARSYLKYWDGKLSLSPTPQQQAALKLATLLAALPEEPSLSPEVETSSPSL